MQIFAARVTTNLVIKIKCFYFPLVGTWFDILAFLDGTARSFFFASRRTRLRERRTFTFANSLTYSTAAFAPKARAATTLPTIGCQILRLPKSPTETTARYA